MQISTVPSVLKMVISSLKIWGEGKIGDMFVIRGRWQVRVENVRLEKLF